LIEIGFQFIKGGNETSNASLVRNLALAHEVIISIKNASIFK